MLSATAYLLKGGLLAAALLAAGCGRQRERQTPLHDAAESGDVVSVQMALDGGHRVNVPDEGGATPLHTAAREAHEEVMRFLIAEGADVNAADLDGDTPLDYARDRAAAALLRRHGATAGTARREKPASGQEQGEGIGSRGDR